MLSPRTFAIVTLAVVGLAAASAPASAQIVNTQPLLSGIDQDGASGELTASLDWRTGNVDLLRASSSFLLLYRSQPHTLISSSQFDFGQKSGDNFLFKVFSHLRYQLWLSDLLTWEVYAQVTHDQFKRLTVRALGGTGPRFAILPGPLVSLSAGVSYMFEFERYSDDSTLPDSGASQKNHRISAYLNGRFQLDDFVTFIQTLYYQPRVDAFVDDYRILSDTQLALRVAKGLAVSFSVSVAYDSDPPAAVEGLDTTTLVSLTVAL